VAEEQRSLLNAIPGMGMVAGVSLTCAMSRLRGGGDSADYKMGGAMLPQGRYAVLVRAVSGFSPDRRTSPSLRASRGSASLFVVLGMALYLGKIHNTT